MQYLIATTFEVVHYIALQAVHYKPLQEVHLSRYNHRLLESVNVSVYSPGYNFQLRRNLIDRQRIIVLQHLHQTQRKDYLWLVHLAVILVIC